MCILVLLQLLYVSGSATAQQERPREPVSAFLPADHWAVAAARRMARLGLADADFGWGDGSVTIGAVARVLHDASGIAGRDHPSFVRLARGYWERFEDEFPRTATNISSSADRTLFTEGWLSVGYSSANGRLYPVRSISNSREDVSGPFPRQDRSEAGVTGSLNFSAGNYFGGSLTPEHRDGEWTIREGYALAAWKKVGVWGGRRAPSFATGAGGGIVLSGNAAFTGGGIVLTEPIRLPWILRHIGAIRYESFLSRLDSNAAVPRPWFFATHASISPHPRLLIGVTQAFMFGGEGVAPFTWDNFKEMFFSHGLRSAGTEFENGIASGEVRFTPPLPIIPLTLYMEWGADDNHAAWTLFPGRVFGARVDAVPGIPSLSLGLEHAGFSRPCTGCGGCHCEYYATWYRHYLFKDGWTVDRQPIGHPLGGDGSEWLAYGTWDDPTNRLRVEGSAFHRRRGEYNIYAPARAGTSIGGRIAATYRTRADLDLFFKGAFENGDGTWKESSIFAGMRWTF